MRIISFKQHLSALVTLRIYGYILFTARNFLPVTGYRGQMRNYNQEDINWKVKQH